MNMFFTAADSYRDVFRAADITTDAMKHAIKDWRELYYQRAATEREDPCQRIPFTIVRKLTKTTFSEYTASGKDDFCQGVLDALDKKREKAMQKALIGGECKLKPVPGKNGFRFAVVPRENILVFGRDVDGNMTDIGTMETIIRNQFYYTLLERRTVDANGYLTIRNYLRKSTTEGSLGQPTPLTEVPEYHCDRQHLRW